MHCILIYYIINIIYLKKFHWKILFINYFLNVKHLFNLQPSLHINELAFTGCKDCDYMIISPVDIISWDLNHYMFFVHLCDNANVLQAWITEMDVYL